MADEVRVIHGDALQVLPTLEAGSVDAIVTDPPYGEGMGIEGDKSIWQASELLSAMLRAAVPVLRQNGHAAIFWPMRTLDICIDAVRESGLTYRRTLGMYLPGTAARPYLGWLPRLQGIVLAQKYLDRPIHEFHREMAEHIATAIERSGLSRAEIAKQLGCDSRLILKWSRPGDPSWCIPTPRFYSRLKVMLSLDPRFDVLINRQPSQELNSRSDLDHRPDLYIVDDRPGEKHHPCQKPFRVVSHIVRCLAAPGEMVLDPFAGGGTTPTACFKTGRRCIAIEIDARHVAASNRRLAGAATPLFDAMEATP